MENQKSDESLEAAARRLQAQCQQLAEIQYLPQVDSTNSWLKARYEAGAVTRAVLVLTDCQTAGRGTRGREWLQGGQDIALSCGAPVPAGPELNPRLSLAVGALVAETVEAATGLATRVKWPNDVLAAGKEVQGTRSWRKVSGTLIETHLSDRQRLLVIGVGINVNSTAGDYPHPLAARLTTLRDAVGSSIDRAALVERLSLALLALVELTANTVQDAAGLSEQIDRLAEQWFARDITSGTQYRLSRDDEVRLVVAQRVDRRTGGLVCLDEQRHEHLVTSYTELTAVDEDQ